MKKLMFIIAMLCGMQSAMFAQSKVSTIKDTRGVTQYSVYRNGSNYTFKSKTGVVVGRATNYGRYVNFYDQRGVKVGSYWNY